MKVRNLALSEVTVVFLLGVLVFRGILLLAPESGWMFAIIRRRSFLPYLALLIIPLVLQAATKRDWRAYGLTFRPWKEHLRVFAICLLPVMTLSLALNQINWHTWGGAFAVSAVAVGMLVLVTWLLRKKEPAAQAAVVGALILVPVQGPMQQTGIAGALVQLIYFYVFVAVAEEVFFRGYIQSRLNQAFERPFRFVGIQWGWGLVIASLFFGIWHIALSPLNTSLWPHALWTMFAGLLFGIVREHSRSVVTSTLLHGVLNYSPLAVVFDLMK